MRLSARWATELLWQPPEEYICEIVEMLCVRNVSYCLLLEIKLLLLNKPWTHVTWFECPLVLHLFVVYTYSFSELLGRCDSYINYAFKAIPMKSKSSFVHISKFILKDATNTSFVKGTHVSAVVRDDTKMIQRNTVVQFHQWNNIYFAWHVQILKYLLGLDTSISPMEQNLFLMTRTDSKIFTWLGKYTQPIFYDSKYRHKPLHDISPSVYMLMIFITNHV